MQLKSVQNAALLATRNVLASAAAAERRQNLIDLSERGTCERQHYQGHLKSAEQAIWDLQFGVHRFGTFEVKAITISNRETPIIRRWERLARYFTFCFEES